MYETVLVPTDGSERSTTALSHAIDLADRHDATVHVLYVVESSSAFARDLDAETEAEVYGSLTAAGEEAVGAVAAEVRAAGLAVETAVDRGVPHEEILAYVDHAGIDVVVMATAGRTGQARELVGSVAERVVRAAPVPVLTVNEPE